MTNRSKSEVKGVKRASGKRRGSMRTRFRSGMSKADRKGTERFGVEIAWVLSPTNPLLYWSFDLYAS